MKLTLYKEIINCLQNRKLPITIEYLRELTEKFAGTKEETLYSIADQLNQRRAKATLWKHSRESNTLFETILNCLLCTSVGEEYETFLKKKLRESNIAFLDENVLRKDGYDKTPDIKLEVPIGVNGKVVNWIESKALFADEECHKTYLKEQLWSYWNRFGSGLVIYWFGYIDDLNFQDEKGIQIMDEFPTEFVQPS
ncbi:DgyrCDS2968 [Dimorphilus gyrociliatus]|uniref:CDAN1-interacting nuclease 1 n=1 Tax=Dimorphilus gyrociliatus TaxID=2664684 RepID=A0A7I8VD13_9ANNE|nr:DgyrCDS2968 [Dimorphilus gyrociliatus]